MPEALSVIHLNEPVAASAKYRAISKRGGQARQLIAKHLKLSAEHGALERFRPLAKRLLVRSLQTCLYHGFRREALTIVREFRDIFPWYWRIGVYVLTILPPVTSAVLRSTAYLRYRMGLEKDVSRRWLHRTSRKEPHDQNSRY